ncbi:MAG: hypothetical protein U5L06_00670 [Rhodovibrio sp.]|nr:hypothetical protein [Rhodovibrio sp.]
MIIGWKDKIADAALSTGSNVQLTVENAKVNPLAKPFRGANSSGFGGGQNETTLQILWDYGSQTDWNLFAALPAGQGFDVLTNTDIRVRLSNTSAGGTDVYDSGAISGGALVGYRQLYHRLPLTKTARYGAFDITVNAVVDAIDVGRFLGYGGSGALSGYWAPPVGQSYGDSFSWQDDSDTRKTLGRQRLERPLPRYRRGRFKLGFNTEAEMMDNAFEIARENGVVGDVLVMARPDDYPQKRSIFGPITRVQEFNHDSFDKVSVEYTVEQRL